MKKIIAFAGSNSSRSINHKLVEFTTSNIKSHSINIIKLTDYNLPIFGEDIEREEGYPNALSRLHDEIKSADAVIISVNEHNGAVSAFFKNTMDWLSRINIKFLEHKKVLLLSTSNGRRGGLGALNYMNSMVPRYGGEVIESYAFPSFSKNLSIEDQSITDDTIKSEFEKLLLNFESQVTM